MKIPGIVSAHAAIFHLSREQLKLLGANLHAAGDMLEFGGAYLIASSITTRQAEAAEQAVEQAADCKTRLTNLGYRRDD